MKGWIPVIGMVLGFTVGYTVLSMLKIQIPPHYAQYISIAALAGLDTALGGIRGGMEGRFQNDIFISGFILNTSLAAGLAWLGERIGLNLTLVAVIVLGQRVFMNLSLIRRFYINKRAIEMSKRLEEKEARTASERKTEAANF